MSVRNILIHPDPRLKKAADPLAEVDDAARALIDDMFETMYDAPGIGLAAPQIGVLNRVLVMDCSEREADGRAPIAMVNPELVWASGDMNVHEEGCLSIPDHYGDVRRPGSVAVRWLDRDGAVCERTFEGLWATCVQHEIDHLDGKLFIDHLSALRRSMITNKMKKLKRELAKAT